MLLVCGVDGPGAHSQAHEAALHNVRQYVIGGRLVLVQLTDCLRDDHIFRVVVDLSNILRGSEGD